MIEEIVKLAGSNINKHEIEIAIDNGNFEINSLILDYEKFIDIYEIRLNICRGRGTHIDGFEDLMINARKFNENIRITTIRFFYEVSWKDFSFFTDTELTILLGIIRWDESKV